MTSHLLAAAPADDTVKFNRDIRPILSETCFQCHGPDAKSRKAKLRLDVREDALKPAKSGDTPIVPGQPDQSEILRRVFSQDPDEMMPPPELHKVVSSGQKDLLKRWVTQGAPYEAHWAYTAPVRPPLPGLQQKDWPRNPLDFFILARLESESLPPSAEADRTTLIRRVTLDLTGLPPTLAEVDAFLADDPAGAYERVVDRLLTSPHYGERMAVDWLDAARYADTNGYQVDRDREMYAWRDWVIDAFNVNQRFDQFTIEQLAGDLLPQPTLAQRIATGFHRNNMVNEEGGAIAEEFLAEYTADRVETTASVWLAQTFNCTRCHDHKFDPFTQRDFYSLKAFFHNVPERGAGEYNLSIRKNTPPSVKLPDAAIEAKIQALNAELATVKRELAAPPADSPDAAAEWAQKITAPTEPWTPAIPRLDRLAVECAHGGQRSAVASGYPATAERCPPGAFLRTAIQLDASEPGLARLKSAVSGVQQPQLVARLGWWPQLRRLNERLTNLKRQIDAAEAAIPITLVMEEMAQPRPTFILQRGAYDKPGERVIATTPAALPPLGADQPSNRLGLARWLVDPANPLTARVTVNRLWQSVFGAGLVRTAEDFGSQGEAPSHPELLDWLATEFLRTGWDVKAMMRLLVTSATYRQRSALTPVLSQRDPTNRLLARGPRFRLQAEFVRDQALAASGLLAAKIGGVSVKPYHPAGLYEQVTSGSGYTKYVRGKGDELHRRSIYTYWKRSVPNPAMLLFDAPFREACTVRRPRTNTPLQALNLMNDPTYVEAGRFLAQRMLKDGGTTSEARLSYGFRLLLSRVPRPAELAVLRAAYERTRADFENDPKAAAALLSVGDAAADPALDRVELAAYAMVAGTMLNLDAVIIKD